jgi:hypothetical protein
VIACLNLYFVTVHSFRKHEFYEVTPILFVSNPANVSYAMYVAQTFHRKDSLPGLILFLQGWNVDQVER